MNIFFLDNDPHVSARLMCNKHMSKMIIESAQMLSTCHRMVDGFLEKRISMSGKRMVKYYVIEDWREQWLYRAVHHNHPCNLWIRETSSNYLWLYEHFVGLCNEFTRRYGKVHETERKLKSVLKKIPNNLNRGPLTPPALAMTNNPDCIVEGNPVKSYRNFYNSKQKRFKMVWPEGEQPEWFIREVE